MNKRLSWFFSRKETQNRVRIRRDIFYISILFYTKFSAINLSAVF